MVCDALHLQVTAGQPGVRDAQVLSLSLLKLDPSRLMAVLGDVTQSVKRDRALRHSQAWINALVTGIADYALVPLDGSGCVQLWNPGIERVTGLTQLATLGHPFSVFYPPDSVPHERVLDRLHEADNNGWSLDEGWCLRADGTRYWGSCLIAPLHPSDEAPTGEPAYSLIIRDISDRRQASEALRQSISCDHLTGLANRRAFFEAAQFELQRWGRLPRPVSVVMVDADHFKAVNDSFGHGAGDTVLQQLAACMSATFRSVDVVARIGGEEFAVLLPGTSIEGAEMVAARLCHSVALQKVQVDGKTIRYTISAGVASMEEGVDGVDALIKRADAALYVAKANGRNRVERWGVDSGRAQALALPV